jgi:hypothetical protein
MASLHGHGTMTVRLQDEDGRPLFPAMSDGLATAAAVSCMAEALIALLEDDDRSRAKELAEQARGFALQRLAPK